MTTIGNEQRTQLIQECRTTLAKLIQHFSSKRPDTYWSGPVVIKRRWWFDAIRDGTLAGWKIPTVDGVIFGVYEDGSIFTQGTITRYKVFSGEIRYKRSGIFRFELEELDTLQLANLSSSLSVL